MSDFQERWERAQLEILPLEESLASKYQSVLASHGREAVSRFNGAITAAGSPIPIPGITPDEMIPPEGFKASIQARTVAIRNRIVNEVASILLGTILADKAAVIPVFSGILESLAEQQAQFAWEAQQEAISTVILDAYREGWSVPETSEQLQSVLKDYAPWQATRLARTDLISLANATSLASAQLLRPEDQPRYKIWLTAQDDRVREAHVKADRQAVPIDQPFTVEGVALMYPGDPTAPAELIMNCRCTQVYADTPNPVLRHSFNGGNEEGDELALAASIFEELKHPRFQKGVREGGRFRGKGLTYERREPARALTQAEQDSRDEELVRLQGDIDGSWGEFMRSGDPEQREHYTNAYNMASAAIGDYQMYGDYTLYVVKGPDGMPIGVGSARTDGGAWEGGSFGAVKGGGLPLFKSFMEDAAASDASVTWTAGNKRAAALYARVGFNPSGDSVFGEYYLEPEKVKRVAEDMFTFARPQAVAAAALLPLFEWDDPFASGPPLDGETAAGFNAAKHPRFEKGTHEGGQFAPKDGTSSHEAQTEAYDAAQGKQEMERTRVHAEIGEIPSDNEELRRGLLESDLTDAQRDAWERAYREGGGWWPRTTKDWSSAEGEKLREEMATSPVIAASVDFTAGTMIALYPENPEELFHPTGQNASDLHVTLAYLPEGLDGEIDTLMSWLRLLAASTPVLTGQVGGVGYFAPGDNGVPVVAIADVPGLSELAAYATMEAREAGHTVSDTHGFVPHITLAYAVEDEPLPNPNVVGIPLEFRFLSLVAGADRVDFPFEQADE